MGITYFLLVAFRWFVGEENQWIVVKAPATKGRETVWGRFKEKGHKERRVIHDQREISTEESGLSPHLCYMGEKRLSPLWNRDSPWYRAGHGAMLDRRWPRWRFFGSHGGWYCGPYLPTPSQFESKSIVVPPSEGTSSAGVPERRACPVSSPEGIPPGG